MNSRHCTLILLLLLVGAHGFSQEQEMPKEKKNKSESLRTDGLRKIYTAWNHDIDVNIDEKMLEATINSAVENAMRSVEVALEKIEVNIPPIEIDLKGLGEMNHLDTPDVHIPPIEIDLHQLDINMNYQGWQNFHQKSQKNDSDKSKGLKKLN